MSAEYQEYLEMTNSVAAPRDRSVRHTAEEIAKQEARLERLMYGYDNPGSLVVNEAEAYWRGVG